MKLPADRQAAGFAPQPGSTDLSRPRPARRACTQALLRGVCAIGVVGILSGCSIRPPQNESEVRIDSVTVPQANVGPAVAAPFCLHLRHRNLFLVAYSRNSVEAWATDGSCDSKGAARSVDGIRLHWRADLHQAQEARHCMVTDRCAHTEQNAIEGRFIRCATASARQGNQVAYVSSDEARCN